jgi:hypothetical protein
LGIVASGVRAVVLLDTFTRAAGSLNATTANTGQTWATGTSCISFSINSSGQIAAMGGGDNYSAIATGKSDFTVSTDLTYAAGEQPLLVFRCPGDTTFGSFLAAWITDTAIYLGTKSTGAISTITSASYTFTGGNTYAVAVTCTGSDIYFRVNGSLVLSHSTSSYQSQTGVGFYKWNSSSSVWDNLTVTR